MLSILLECLLLFRNNYIQLSSSSSDDYDVDIQWELVVSNFIINKSDVLISNYTSYKSFYYFTYKVSCLLGF